MLPSCRKLTRLTARALTWTKPPLSTRNTQCVIACCMSSACQAAASPERSKRRRLNSQPLSGTRALSKMAPMLIQEVEDEPAPPSKVELSQVETTFQRLLLDVAKHIDESSPTSGADSQLALPEALAKEPIVLRFTGGWVRDKLLGVPSHDIDVAINKMTGYQFGLRMKEYLELPGNLEKYGLESIAANEKQNQKAGTTDKSRTVGGLHKIEANPEKSKHLETTTLRILGLDIDLVNLRKETYSDDSRNPQIEFGTPEEDALRRDATVNAMFYNINTSEIEDFTGRGHKDMRDKILRTPLEPYQTFKDDPLRVLRLIRFASRLAYTIDSNVLEAMEHPDIKDALRRKISRERVGTELEKALQGPDPHEALRLILALGLYETIFSDPAVANSDHYKPELGHGEVIINTLRDIMDDGGTLQEHLLRDKDERYLAWQLAALVPYRDAPQPEPSEPGRKAPPPLPVTVAREGVKATNKTSDVILFAVRHLNEISNIVDRLYDKQRRPDKKFSGKDPGARDLLGMAIREWGATWRSQVLYSMLVEVANNHEQVQSIQRKYVTFIEVLRDLKILDACTLKPVLDGKALARAIGIPPGPWMKDALDVVMAWQLRNPGATDPEQAIEEIKTHQSNGELKHDLIRHFLQLTIRPLFIKTSPSTITEQGRKVTTPALPKKFTVQNQDDSVNKPWKSSKDIYALEILRWVVESLDEKIVAEVWPLVVPPILTLLDDWETTYKRIGANRLDAFLHATPSSLLERTGLGDVFEEALLPCLAYLPSITPETECVELLSAVYPALLTLARTRFPKSPITPSHPSETSVPTDERRRQQLTRSLDTVVRRGIIYAYTHCSNYHNISRILFDQLAAFFDELGIDSVKHIKYVLPMLTQTLSHPLGLSNGPVLLSALGGMQALIRNCWPRMAEYRGEVLKGLCLCWLLKFRKDDSETAAAAAGGEGHEMLETKLKETVKMLAVAIGTEKVDFQTECKTLMDADGRLSGLFCEESSAGSKV